MGVAMPRSVAGCFTTQMLSSETVSPAPAEDLLEVTLQATPVGCLAVIRGKGLLMPVLPAFAAVDPHLADELRVAVL